MPSGPARLDRIREIFLAFLALGLTSFGGPAAHLGYFRNEFVARRRWLSEQDYADLVALCQFLPGPASSQVGFAIGLQRGGGWGAAAAWTAFTLPSALILVVFALSAGLLDGPVSQGIIHGLKVAAVAVVAHAVLGMARSLCPDQQRAGIALAAVLLVVFIGGTAGQVFAIAIGALAGLILCRSANDGAAGHSSLPVSAGAGRFSALLYLLLLAGLPLLVWLTPSPLLDMLDGFYRAGALVFGGGHVMLPLLEAEVVQTGKVTANEFLAGYGAAQAVPGPLFTFAAYLGAVMQPATPVLWAMLALLVIFLPGILILLAVLPHWNNFRRWHRAQALMRGANAAVVGILGAALYQPVFSSAIIGPEEFALALTGFLLLSVWKLPAWGVVIAMALGGILLVP
ncbi:chromate efflux transporter [Marinobacter daepoensis]|uniref:chromate efflux transporter n=1 Tax=Marinobacter daepoensis TaxID=262077 RepID=UPI001C95B16C|nr:chromate efflux transporter [Marinobacter daepoensis]MBY6033731.1 chromate efflux transporter [Marinobacter daepoensis]